MDRFIVVESIDDEYHYANLKSNMDRFIALAVTRGFRSLLGLKSNMDRFIVQFEKHFSCHSCI